MTLIEVLVALMVSLVIGGIVFQGFGVLRTGHEIGERQNYAIANGRTGIDMLADHVRNAERCTSLIGCVNNAMIAPGSNATTLTYYTASTGSPVTYSFRGGSLYRTKGGVETRILRGLQSFSVTYLMNGAFLDQWTEAGTPSATNAPTICGVRIRATGFENTRQFVVETSVRLRNARRTPRFDRS